MTDPIWLPGCYKISTKLVLVSIKYIFIHANKDVIAEKKNGLYFKKKEIKCKEMVF